MRLGFLVLSSPVPLVGWGVWGLVGLLFEICIVDASIFMISTWLFLVPALGWGRGWWVGVVSV